MNIAPATARRWWSAVQRRDAAFDEAFVFGVTTTGVYCRASCPARRPLFEHVVFHRSKQEAERDGYRACRRCGTAPSGGVLRACEFIAHHIEEPIPLERLGRHVGWSPFHLQRVFRRSLGVTPKEFARRLRIERFRRHVRAGIGIAPAMYAAGFGSSSRLYERSIDNLGMTPAVYAEKGIGMTIGYDVIDCPLGRALIAATPLGLCSVEFGDSERALVSDLRAQFPRATVRRDPGMLRYARERLEKLFSGAVRDPNLPLDIRATVFQTRVWESLRSIPYGETRTYAEVARAIGRPRAVRAVGNACARNPVALVIPCHRVVGTDGGLHGYRGGLEKKRKLLSMERAQRSAAVPVS
jgi:AraC family transcriptional regulator of adaptative response/methylated-DNA-[protein]-cysteine methyltransferase